MFVRINYGLVILIWATTPLAIKLGGETFAPIAGLSLRIALAFVVGCTVLTLCGLTGLMIRERWQLYFAASLGVFPTMALVYMAADYLPSGLLSIAFGLTPFFTAFMAGPILGERLLQPRKVGGTLIACCGLLLIVMDDIAIGDQGEKGLLLMLISNLFFSGSALWVKKLNQRLSVEPFEQSLGGMAFAMPGLAMCWVYVFGLEPLTVTATSLTSLLYLSLVATLVGFVAYYHILKHLAVETVAIIPLITPLLAISVGVLILDEAVTLAMMFGVALILSGLAVHQGVFANALIRKSR